VPERGRFDGGDGVLECEVLNYQTELWWQGHEWRALFDWFGGGDDFMHFFELALVRSETRC
jgi:hypothetical protein